MSGKRKTLWHDQRGFTVAELLIVLALLGVVLAIAYDLFFYAQTSFNRSLAEGRVIQDTRLALMTLENEIVQARKATEEFEAVRRVSETQLDVYCDVTGDAKPELIRYQLNGNTLTRSVASPTGDHYPYTYGTPANTTTVLSRVNNADVFQSVALIDDQDPDNHRVRVAIRLLVDDSVSPLQQPLEVTATYVSRSRAAAD
ncbi:MAG: prepilin-type N-terminal cleavage/methylation domain-containing protein [Thermoanaerobacterales bacterium]|nr:prepilin-type N-terminal cleavage/methylation domain-containing protein [Thermoanaerobacterales bacterium]